MDFGYYELRLRQKDEKTYYDFLTIDTYSNERKVLGRELNFKTGSII